MSPDDRFDDARAFSAALSAAIGHSGETLTTHVQRRSFASRPMLWAGAVAALITVVAGSTPQGRDEFDLITGRIDTAQYAIVPFRYTDASRVTDEQEPVARGLYAAMREWDGLKLSSDMSVSDAVRHVADSTFDGRMAVARRARAGKLIWGHVHVTPDSMIVRASVYNAVNGALIREVPFAGSRAFMSTHPSAMRELAADLLRQAGSEKLPHSGDVGTRSFAAWREYQVGEAHLYTWRVAPAIQSFARAAVADPDYAHAQVWLAQLLMWRSRPGAQWAAEWSPHLSAALRNRAALDVRENAVLDALRAIQVGNFAAACASYDGMRMRDSLDAAAWLGLAYCQGLDPLVVRASTSHTGWAFRGSRASAQRAYARAIQIAPASFAAFPFSTVDRLFAIEANSFRWGANADSARFFGFPDLVHDTIAHEARPWSELNRTAFEAMVPSYDRALMRTREVMITMLSVLVQRVPDNADAFELLAHVLEMRDEISGTPNGGYSALSAIDRAKILSTDSVQRARIGATDVRLHLKLGDFARTAAIGDSVLASAPVTSGERAEYLAGIAALLGHEHAAIAYLRASGSSVAISGAPAVPLVEDVSTALFVRSALGVCDDSLRALQRRIAPMLDSYVNASQRDDAMSGVLQRPMLLGVRCFGVAATIGLRSQPGLLLTAVQSLGRGDRKAARLQLDSMQMRRLVRPGDVSLDETVGEATLSVALGDTLGAIRGLDLTLTALPTLSRYVVYEPGMAASVGRAMALRAELAAGVHDRGSAALWAGRVLTLWAHSDPSLVPTLARMRVLANQRAP